MRQIEARSLCVPASQLRMLGNCCSHRRREKGGGVSMRSTAKERSRVTILILRVATKFFELSLALTRISIRQVVSESYRETNSSRQLEQPPKQQVRLRFLN